MIRDLTEAGAWTLLYAADLAPEVTVAELDEAVPPLRELGAATAELLAGTTS